MKKIILTCLALLTVGLLFVAPVSAAADKVNCPADNGKTKKDADGNKYTAYCCGTSQTSIDFSCKSGTLTVTSVLLTILNFLAVGVGIAVVGGIAWGGVTYITSDGNAAKAQQGVVIIINSVVGLLMFIFMYGILNFLVPGGLFN